MQIKALLRIAPFVLLLANCTSPAQTVQPDLKLEMAGAAKFQVPGGARLEVIAGVPVVNDVYLNGQGPFRFLLDTGSEGNQIEARLAQRLGIAATLQMQEVTPSGVSQVSGGTVNEVALGGAVASGQEFMLVRGDGFHVLDPSIRGILGQRFLRHFDYTLDFKRHRVLFGSTPASGEQVKFRLASGCMVVATDLGDLLLDSGTGELFLFRESLLGQRTGLVTANGEATARVQRAPSVSVAGRRYYPAEVIVRSVSGAPSAGLLPASLFHAIHVSNSDGYLIFDPGN